MFAQAMDNFAAANQRTTTENGRPSHQTTGEARVDAFFKLVRGLPRETLKAHLSSIVDQATRSNDPQVLVDAFVLWASTRDIRGGKGERQLAHWLFTALAQRFPQTTEALVPLIPEYGSWRDVTALLELDDSTERLNTALISLMSKQLLEDAEPSVKPSLCAKWAPRPKSAHKHVAQQLARALFPEEKHPEPGYRKLVSSINARLETIETKMCNHQWAEIRPGAVPARCLKINRAAFMNETPQKRQRSEEEDRVTCRKQFEEHAILAAKDPSKARMHGRVLHPHEMVAAYMRSPSEDVVLEAQWVDLRERLKAEMPLLGKMVPLVDVSGSMRGTPVEVAVALGILISEVGELKDRFLTFTSTPTWHSMQSDWTLLQKVQSAMSAAWDMSTDFSKALDLVLEACVSGDVPPAEVGELSLVVLSDMQFDAARDSHLLFHHYSGYHGGAPPQASWETQYEELVRKFHEAGLRSKYQVGYPVPRVIFWNLRGGTHDYPATANTPGVDMVSGFSPNLLKLFMEGSLEEMMAEVSLKDSVEEKNGVDPYLTLRKALDNVRYDAVREICAAVGEGAMAGYVVPVGAPAEGAGAEAEEEDFVMVEAEE